MFTMSSSTRRMVAAAGIVTLTATGAAVVQTPAAALSTQQLAYACTWPAIGDFTMSVTHTVGRFDHRRKINHYDHPEPTVWYASTLLVGVNITLSAEAVEALHSEGIASIRGPITDVVLFDQAVLDVDSEVVGYNYDTETWTETVPVPESGPMQLDLGTKAWTDPAADTAMAGDTVPFGLVDLDGAAEITGMFTTYDADDQATGTSPVACELADGQDLTTDIQIPVTQAPSVVAARLKYDPKAGKVIAEGYAWPVYSKVPLTGVLRYTLQRNGKPFATLTKPLKDGSNPVIAKFDGPRKGTYELLVEYPGDDQGNFKPSQRVVTKTF